MKFACVAPLLLFTVLLPVAAQAAEPAPDGGMLFRQRCQSCHSVNPAQNTPIGPNLSGVVGRKAAATGFNYSPALRASRLVWNRATLDRFLTAPMQLVPGTRMVIPVSDPRQRAAIIDFLARTGR